MSVQLAQAIGVPALAVSEAYDSRPRIEHSQTTRLAFLANLRQFEVLFEGITHGLERVGCAF